MTLQALKKTDSRAPLNVSWIWEDVETAEFPPETFDHVLCSSGLAYLEDPDSTFKSFRSWLKPGGRITFNSPKVRIAQTGLHRWLLKGTSLLCPCTLCQALDEQIVWVLHPGQASAHVHLLLG